MLRRRDTGRWARRGRSLVGTGGLRILASAAGGVALFAGFAPSKAWWAPLIGFALLAFAVHGRTWKVSAGLGLIFGITFFFPLLSWTNIYVGNVPWIALAGAESVLMMPGVALMGPASRRLPAWPVWAAAAWIGGETLRALFPFGGFPWGNIAFTQPDGPLLPLAAVIGGAGLAFATALAGLAFGDVLRRLWGWWRGRRHIRHIRYDDQADHADHSRSSQGASVRVGALVATAALVALPFVAGVASIPAVQTGADAQTKPVALVQGNVPQPGLDFEKRAGLVLQMHAEETAKLAQAIKDGSVPQPAAVLWPENSSDLDPYRNANAAQVIDLATKQVGVPILVGAVVNADKPGYVYNMGIVWDPVTGPGQTYTKRHPVPFGEYIPWKPFFRFFSSKVDLVRAPFLPGHRPGNLDINGVAVGDVICFEIVEDSLVRDVVNGGAKMIVVQTNNATFGYTDETYQQQAMSRVRAVEYGREVLIVSTSGVSTVIRPNGAIADSIPLFTAGYAVPQVPLISATTPGTVLGAPVRWAATVAGPLALLLVTVRWRRLWRLVRRGSAREGSPVGETVGERAVSERETTGA